MVTLGTLPGVTFPPTGSPILSLMVPKPYIPELGEGSVEVETWTRGGTPPSRKQLGRQPLWPPSGNRKRNCPAVLRKQQARGLVPLFAASGHYQATEARTGIHRPPMLQQGTAIVNTLNGKKQTSAKAAERSEKWEFVVGIGSI